MGSIPILSTTNKEKRIKDMMPNLSDGSQLDPRDFLAGDKWFDEDIDINILDVTEPYSPPKYTLSWNGVKFAPLGGIHALTGQPGNGKTFTFTQMIVAFLHPNGFGGLKYELRDSIPNPTVLYIDTEQEKENTKLVNLRVYQMLGWSIGVPHDEFKIICLREEENTETRWRKTLKAIYTFRPTVCFLDGMLDVVSDFNNNESCQEYIYKAMKAASFYGMSLWCLVHENPGSTKMVGHLGSMLQRKVTDELSSVKKKDENTGYASFEIKQKKNRGKDMTPWKFHIVDSLSNLGIPEIIGQSSLSSDDFTARTIDVVDFIKNAIPANGLATRTLREAVKSEWNVGGAKAERMMEEWKENKLIRRDENKRYFRGEAIENDNMFEHGEVEQAPF